MKILQVITLSELGGAQSVVINLANKFCEKHEVIVAAGEGDGKMFSMLDSRIKTERCVYLKRALSPTNDFRAVFELKKLYRKYKPDIVHLHSSKAGMLGRVAFPPSKTVYTVHGFDSIRIAYRKFLPIERAMQKRCKAIVGVSKYDYRNLLSENIKNNVSYVYNGITKPCTDNLQHLDIFGKYKKTILSIARVAVPKRHDIFIEASKLLPEYGFIWIGNQQPIEDVPSNCHFLGNIPNAGAYCSKADLFMLPSDYEGMPMVILEAMSFGKPIVASNVGGINEIVIDGQNGYAVENNPAQFADKIQEILQDPEVYTTYCNNSSKIFKNNLTVDRMVDGYLKIYNH